MSRFHRLSLVFAVVLCVPAQAADLASASNRAFLYQREAKAILEDRRWHVSRDENGKLVADHPVGPMGAGGGGNQQLGLTDQLVPANAPMHYFALLTLTFTPDSVIRTKCAANVVGYAFLGNITESARKHAKPYPFNDPDTTKTIQEMMAKAEKQLVEKHPEYGAR